MDTLARVINPLPSRSLFYYVVGVYATGRHNQPIAPYVHSLFFQLHLDNPSFIMFEDMEPIADTVPRRCSLP